MKHSLINIQVLDKSDNPAFDQREQNKIHTTYLEETAFFAFVQRGDVQKVKKLLNGYFGKGIVVGRLSDNPVRQMQYWAVCVITLGIRYAIQGGLDEMTAYNLSDSYIMQVDKLTSTAVITELMGVLVVELTELVRDKAYADCPVPVRKAANYIDAHLHESLRLSDLAAIAALSEDYFSKLFKKHVGETVSGYILRKRLESAKALLNGDCDQKLLGYYLGFCSQTYFISCFKKAYGITPHKYAQTRRGI